MDGFLDAMDEHEQDRQEQILLMKAGIAKFLEEQELPGDHPVVVIGGGAMLLRKIRSSFGDVDLIVPGMSGKVEKVVDIEPLKAMSATYHGVAIDAGGELLVTGLSTEGVVKRATKCEGLLTMSVDDLLAMKKEMNRAVDQDDITLLENFMEYPY